MVNFNKIRLPNINERLFVHSNFANGFLKIQMFSHLPFLHENRHNYLLFSDGSNTIISNIDRTQTFFEHRSDSNGHRTLNIVRPIRWQFSINFHKSGVFYYSWPISIWCYIVAECRKSIMNFWSSMEVFNCASKARNDNTWKTGNQLMKSPLFKAVLALNLLFLK